MQNPPLLTSHGKAAEVQKWSKELVFVPVHSGTAESKEVELRVRSPNAARTSQKTSDPRIRRAFSEFS
jgi:hypothetical protein